MLEACVSRTGGLGTAPGRRYPTRTYSLLCLSEGSRDISNYVLIPVEGAGFVVIKHELEVEEP
ncbi:MAG: hypothetical protein GXO66_02150 [Euryarchaeota archaeon]|nr:hypothetical protein [Euryarchaeota archaeon]